MGAAPNLNAIVEVTIEGLSAEGSGVARYGAAAGPGTTVEERGFVVFVAGALPGELVRARILEVRRSFARAETLSVLRPSAHRRVPACPHFGSCGGCSLQHLEHAAQLEAKRGFVTQALRRLGPGSPPEGSVLLSSGAEYGTRIRARFAVDAARGAVGFRRLRSHAVEDIEHCPALHPQLDAALRALREHLASLSASARASFPGELAAACDDEGFAFAPAPPGLPARTLHPRIGAERFELEADGFFQTHPALLPALIEEATRDLEGELAWDLYAGSGLFARTLAERFARVEAVESAPAAVSAGERTLPPALATRVRFHAGDVPTWLRAQHVAPDAILLDPPRTGAKDAVPELLRLRAPRLRYVSCDPATLARDLGELCAGGYALERVHAFDLFPQTGHVETVVALRLS